MFKTEIEKFVMGDNISISVIKEDGEELAHYAFLKIGLFGRATYAICALGDGYALECVGEDEAEAMNFFEMAVRENLSPMHLFDAVTDYRREFEM